jgi:hypothetical protein
MISLDLGFWQNRIASPYDSDAAAFFSAASINNETQKTAINQLVLGLKSNSLWSKMLALYPFVGGTATTHKFNLKDPRDLDIAYRLTFNGGWTHSANGALPNGTNAYANTFLDPSVALTINNTALGFYSGSSGVGGSATSIGTRSVAGNFVSIVVNASNLYYGQVNDTGSQTTSNTNSFGFFIASRISSTQKIHSIRGTNTTKTETSTAIPAFAIYLGSINNAGTASSFTVHQHRLSFVSTSLSSSDCTALYTLVEAYQLALSRNT